MFRKFFGTKGSPESGESIALSEDAEAAFVEVSSRLESAKNWPLDIRKNDLPKRVEELKKAVRIVLREIDRENHPISTYHERQSPFLRRLLNCTLTTMNYFC